MDKVIAKYFGLLFIMSFLSYALGNGLMEAVQAPGDLPAALINRRNGIFLGGILISVFHTMFNAGLLVIMFRKFRTNHLFLSGLYLGTGILSTLMLALGAVFLLIPVFVSLSFTEIGKFESSMLVALSAFVSNSNFYAYQTGMIVWGLGGLVFCYLLHKSGIVPSIFTFWGYPGYAVFIVGAFLELSGYRVGTIMSIPGGLFELSLSVWVIVKGFRPVGYAG